MGYAIEVPKETTNEKPSVRTFVQQSMDTESVMQCMHLVVVPAATTVEAVMEEYLAGATAACRSGHYSVQGTRLRNQSDCEFCKTLADRGGPSG